MTPADHAVLACCLEATAAPKPGNVDRNRDHPDMRLEHLLAGAHGAAPGLRRAANGAPIGPALEEAIAGMAGVAGRNTHVGSLLLLVPLVRAANDQLTPETCSALVSETTVEDAVAFYRAFDHVSVAVEDPPDGIPDVRAGSGAADELNERGLTLYDVIEAAAHRDDVAREWTTGFERTFSVATALEERHGPLERDITAVYLEALADRPDSLVRTRHGDAVAAEVCERASRLDTAGGLEAVHAEVEAFADELVERSINPGTTADIVVAGLFVALERDWVEHE